MAPLAPGIIGCVQFPPSLFNCPRFQIRLRKEEGGDNKGSMKGKGKPGVRGNSRMKGSLQRRDETV